MIFAFAGHLLDCERRELRRGHRLIALEPQVFDLLVYLVRHRDRVVGKDELVEKIWRGRIVSDSALTTRINAVRRAVGDTGQEQWLVRTHRRYGFRFVGEIGTVVEPERAQPSAVRRGDEAAGFAPAFAEAASIAVLPFAAIGADRAARWFADGLVEDVVTQLARCRGLSVAAPISRLLCAPEVEPGRAGRRLGARYVLQGAVRRVGRQLRVTAHLIDAADSRRLWSDCFEGELGNGFGLQDKFASVIAARVEWTVQSAETRRRGARPDPFEPPHTLRLRAQPIFSSGRESISESLRLLDLAIERDPSYGAALADAANCLQIVDVNGWASDRRLNRRKALGLAHRALHASDDPASVAISAFVMAYFGEEADAAGALLDNALALDPDFAKGWYMRGMTRLYAGQVEAAVACFEKAIELNSDDHIGRRSVAGIGFARFFARRFEDAVLLLRPVIDEFPRWATPYCVLASCHAHLGFPRDCEVIARRLNAADASPVPGAGQFRDTRHRELLLPGLKLAGRAGTA